ncbi:hypothetical protein HK405_001914 [Cladochytrium tenue]|nr:hypothetical protein HK405_001914 [Cladochytrium tenue]
MTSFVFPLALWSAGDGGIAPSTEGGGSSGGAAVRLAAASEGGRRLVVALDGGGLWVASMTPDIILVGHRAPVSALMLCKIELDGPEDDDNIIVTAAEDGEVAMWDIGDGRALQTNSKGFPGVPTCIAVSDCSRDVH